MNKQNNIYILNYDIKWHLTKVSAKGTEQLLINEKDIGIFFKQSLQRIKKNSITIFVPDLKRLYSHIIDIDSSLIEYDISHYKYNSSIYVINITNMFIRKKALILKDYYHFIRQGSANDSLTDKGSYLYEMHCELMLQFQININTRKLLSLTSVSNKIFSLISKDKKGFIKKLNATEDSFIRKGYYGGRNEIYEPIGTNLYYYDINSLYPYIMKEFKMPIGIPKYRHADYFKHNKIETFYGYVEVLVKTTTNKLPILPFRPQNKYLQMGVIYPEGTLRGVYFSEELKYALDNGYEILHIYGGYEFTSSLVFNAFIDKVYDLRSNAKTSFMRKTYKSIMNNLYGFYGATFLKEVTSLDGTIIGIKKRYYSVTISAAITAYARIYMYRFNVTLGLNLVYWDTDGIFVKEPINSNEIGTSIGKFRFISFIDEVVFFAPKMYLYKYEGNCYQYTMKGITIHDYILDGSKMILMTKKGLLRDLKENSLSYTYTISLKNKITGESKVFTFTINNKRAPKRNGLVLLTRPWHIVSK